MPDKPPTVTTPDSATTALALAFAPLDKRAFGLAIGATSGLVVAALTLVSLYHDPGRQFPLGLLALYLPGYTVSWGGAAVGAAWSAVAGFCAGWFTAFTRNLVLATWLMVIRVRIDATSGRDFLDHI